MNSIFRYIIPVLVIVIAGCGREEPETGPKYAPAGHDTKASVYHFAVHPQHNPALLTQAYQPLVDYLNRFMPDGKIELEASRDYASFEEKYRAGKPDFILPNPWQTLEAMSFNYGVIAMAGDPEDFKGIFIIKKDSGISSPKDLIGKTVSYPAETALAACVMSQFFLHEQGIDINRDIKNIYVGSQESSIMNAYIGSSSAAATWPPPWRAFQKTYPKEASELKVVWETGHLVNNSVMARKDLTEDLRQKVMNSLLELHSSPEGKAILAGMGTARFFRATDRDYDVVRDYVSRFEKEVRPVRSR